MAAEQADAPILEGLNTTYQVKTAGYRETFSDKAKAERAYNRVKNRKTRNKEEFTLRLSEKRTGSRTWETIGEAVFDEHNYE